MRWSPRIFASIYTKAPAVDHFFPKTQKSLINTIVIATHQSRKCVLILYTNFLKKFGALVSTSLTNFINIDGVVYGIQISSAT